MNRFDKLEEARIALANGITELERDIGNDAVALADGVNTALRDLHTARRILVEMLQ